MIGLTIAVFIVLIALWVAYKIILMSKGDDLFEQQLPRYGFFYDSEIPDERTFQLYEVVFYFGERYYVRNFRTTCDNRIILTLVCYYGEMVEHEVDCVDSREVKKIVRGDVF